MTGPPVILTPVDRVPELSVKPPLGPYRLLDEIGRGGQGVVYRAQDLATGQIVAVKRLHRQSSCTTDAERKFVRECRMLAALAHPNVVGILGAGRDSTGALFIVMPHVAGPTLDAYLAAYRGRTDYLEEVLRVFACLARALDAVHQHGILHRDLKPSNIRVDAAGQPHILDFGLAMEQTDGSPGVLSGTVPGRVLGSLQWSSPELLDGRLLDGRSDLYSLAVFLYVALAGQFPYPVTGPPQEVMASILTAKPAPLAILGGSLQATVGLRPVLGKALAKLPAQRFANGAQLAKALEQTVDQTTVFRMARALVERYRWRIAMGGLGAAFLGVACMAPSRYSVPAVHTAYTNSVGIDFVLVPAGEFVMGSPEDEPDRGQDERLHRVRITKPLLMSAGEVTASQYLRVMDRIPNAPASGDTMPAAGVSWTDATEFCRRLSQREGRRYRLPTEAEWEYACRAGSPDPFGGEAADQVGWFRGNVGDLRTAPVRAKHPNAWGLWDMHGSVAEWCSDRYGPYPTGAVEDPQGAADGTVRVLRGGHVASQAGDCRSAARATAPPDWRGGPVGIRLVLELSPKP